MPRKTTAEQDKIIIQRITENPKMTAKEIIVAEGKYY